MFGDRERERTLKEIRAEFASPGQDYRGAPFWSWNDRLAPEELARQVRAMKEAGMGGFFMHSREGLETPYMGPVWMECIKAAVDEAKRQGMNAWLYDEDRWPSGAAGGLVPRAAGDEGRAKELVLETYEPGVDEKPAGRFDEIHGAVTLGTFWARIEDGRLLDLAAVADLSSPPGPGWTGLAIKRVIAKPSPWYNGDTYGDNLNHASVKTFIEQNYESYAKAVGGDFGATVPGIFTDEPNVAANSWGEDLPQLPWTDGFPAYFQKKRGYDVVPYLPYVFITGDMSVSIRHDYWRTVAELFAEAYSKQLGEWAEAHGLAFTGHYLLEQPIADAVRVGGSTMPHYAYQAVPGIDILCERIAETLTVKQCASAAHQFGRSRVLSELYGCTGWEFTFEGQKWVGDWQYALGVNLRCQHLALYSLKGCRKRDYPGSFNYNTTWWKYNKVVEDYFARLSAVLSAGEPVRDILVVHPLASVWAAHDGKHGGPGDAIGEGLQTLAETLLGLHRDFDFGDESIMEQHGFVCDSEFHVGQAAYRLVILPGMTILRAGTVGLLRGFLDAGGKVIALTPRPTLIDARPAPELDTLFAHPNMLLLDAENALAAALERLLPAGLRIQEPPGQEARRLYCMERSLEGKRAYFVINTDRNAAHEVELSLAVRGRVEEWDPLTGKIEEIPAIYRKGFTRLKAAFAPAGSRLFVVDPAQPSAITAPKTTRARSAKYLGPVTDFQRTEPNVLTIDTCQYRFAGAAWSDTMPVWQAQQAVRAALDMRQVHLNGNEQRWRWVDTPHPKDGARVDFRLSFAVRDLPLRPVHLVLEQAREFSIMLNGKAVSNEADGWYLDRGFARIPLPALQPGENEIVLSCGYKNRMEVEDCYLIGDFGVDAVSREITSEPGRLRFGDWCLQGYPHYAGSMLYRQEIDLDPKEGEKVLLTLGEYWAITIAVRVNDILAGHIPWRAANGLDITRAVRPGRNQIEIEVVASPRNMMGPLHRKPGWELWTSAESFRTEGDRYTPDYVLVPFGLAGLVKVEIMEERQD